MKILLKTQEMYRVQTEAEARQLIDAAKADGHGEVVKYNCQHREQKQKGEVIDDWYRVTIDRVFTSEKEPDEYSSTTITYSNGNSAF